MTSDDDKAARAAEFARLLDAWGGDPNRWPEDVRMKMTRLATVEVEQRRLLREARQLEQALETVRDAPVAAPSSLVDRIMLAAPGSALAPRLQPASATGGVAQVIELPRRRPPTAAAAGAGRRWHAAGLMAASLLAGLYIGGNINVAPVVQELADAVGLSTVVYSALSEDLSEEETL